MNVLVISNCSGADKVFIGNALAFGLIISNKLDNTSRTTLYTILYKLYYILYYIYVNINIPNKIITIYICI